MIFTRSFTLFSIIILSLLCSSCGYRVGQGSLPSCYSSICVPYVLGDKTGELTAEIVREISVSGGFRYCSSGADLILNVAIIDLQEKNIGFRYERDKDGDRIHTIIPAETRLNALVEVSVTEACSGSIVLGPARITASVEFDHDYYFTQNDENVFSLGQLTDYDAAYDAAQGPLNRALAKKIADYVIHSW